MLYELACGRRPFAGSNAAQLLEAILREDVPPFPDRAARRPACRRSSGSSGGCSRAIRRTALRQPCRGPRRPGDDPRAADAWRRIESGRERNSIAVAGFVNISGQPGRRLARRRDLGDADGRRRPARGRVGHCPRARVRNPQDAEPADSGERGEALLLQAGRELRARWIVSGAFQRSGDAVRVTASVTEVASGQLVGTARVDGQLHAVFELQDRLVRELAAIARLPRGGRRRRRPAAPETEVVEAYEAFSRGLLNRSAETFESLDRAVWLFERAVTLDPSYARAHIELGRLVRAPKPAICRCRSCGSARSPASGARSSCSRDPRAPGASSARRWSTWARTPRGWPRSGARWPSIPRTPAPARRWVARSSSAAPGSPRPTEWFARALERNPKGGWYALQLAHCAALIARLRAGRARRRRGDGSSRKRSSPGREGLFIAGAYMRAGHLAALQGRHERGGRLLRARDRLPRAHRARAAKPDPRRAERAAGRGRICSSASTRKAQAVFDVALESFDRRVRLGADDPFTRYYAAAIHALRGDAEPALAFLERALVAAARLHRGARPHRARVRSASRRPAIPAAARDLRSPSPEWRFPTGSIDELELRETLVGGCRLEDRRREV